MTSKEFDQLIDEYGDDIFGFCCHLTGDRGKAEDLYQDTMLAAVQIRSRIRSGQKEEVDESRVLTQARNYLMGVAVRLYRRGLRTGRRESSYLTQGDPEEAFSRFPLDADPEEEVERRMLRQLVAETVSGLPLSLRSVVYMHYYAGMKLSEIAGTLHLPLGTVKRRLHTAREKIRIELEVKGYDNIG